LCGRAKDRLRVSSVRFQMIAVKLTRFVVSSIGIAYDGDKSESVSGAKASFKVSISSFWINPPV